MSKSNKKKLEEVKSDDLEIASGGCGNKTRHVQCNGGQQGGNNNMMMMMMMMNLLKKDDTSSRRRKR